MRSNDVPREQRVFHHHHRPFAQNGQDPSNLVGSQSHINRNALSTFSGDLPDGLSASLQPLNVSTFLYDNQNNHHHHHHHHLHHPVPLSGKYVILLVLFQKVNSSEKYVCQC